MGNLKPESFPDDDEEMSKARRSSLFVGSLEKGLQILRVVDRERRDMGLSEIVEASGLDKSSVQRFTTARARLPAQG
jgi:IclR family pca regulon transcriptional regulator